MKYFSDADKSFVLVGKYPIKEDYFLTKSELDLDSPLQIQVRPTR